MTPSSERPVEYWPPGLSVSVDYSQPSIAGRMEAWKPVYCCCYEYYDYYCDADADAEADDVVVVVVVVCQNMLFRVTGYSGIWLER